MKKLFFVALLWLSAVLPVSMIAQDANYVVDSSRIGQKNVVFNGEYYTVKQIISATKFVSDNIESYHAVDSSTVQIYVQEFNPRSWPDYRALMIKAQTLCRKVDENIIISTKHDSVIRRYAFINAFPNRVYQGKYLEAKLKASGRITMWEKPTELYEEAPGLIVFISFWLLGFFAFLLSFAYGKARNFAGVMSLVASAILFIVTLTFSGFIGWFILIFLAGAGGVSIGCIFTDSEDRATSIGMAAGSFALSLISFVLILL